MKTADADIQALQETTMILIDSILMLAGPELQKLMGVLHQDSKKAICSFKPLCPGGNHQPCTFSDRALPGLKMGVCQ
jgi:hypothetical protein